MHDTLDRIEVHRKAREDVEIAVHLAVAHASAHAESIYFNIYGAAAAALKSFQYHVGP